MRSPRVLGYAYSTMNLALQISKLEWIERCFFVLHKFTIPVMFFERVQCGSFSKGPAVY